MIREIQGKIPKVPAKFKNSNEISGAVNVILNRVGPLAIDYSVLTLKFIQPSTKNNNNCGQKLVS